MYIKNNKNIIERIGTALLVVTYRPQYNTFKTIIVLNIYNVKYDFFRFKNKKGESS